MTKPDVSHLQFIVVFFEDGTIGRLQIHKSPRLPEGADRPGYDPETGIRKLTDKVIQWEIENTLWDKPEGYVITGWQKVKYGDFPDDTIYREAWVMDGKKIAIDIDKAKDIHKKILRAMRKPELEALDGEFITAIETDDADAKKDVIARKQKLRDVTAAPAIEEAKSIEDLKVLTLEALTEEPA